MGMKWKHINEKEAKSMRLSILSILLLILSFMLYILIAGYEPKNNFSIILLSIFWIWDLIGLITNIIKR